MPSNSDEYFLNIENRGCGDGYTASLNVYGAPFPPFENTKGWAVSVDNVSLVAAFNRVFKAKRGDVTIRVFDTESKSWNETRDLLDYVGVEVLKDEYVFDSMDRLIDSVNRMFNSALSQYKLWFMVESGKIVMYTTRVTNDTQAVYASKRMGRLLGGFSWEKSLADEMEFRLNVRGSDEYFSTINSTGRQDLLGRKIKKYESNNDVMSSVDIDQILVKTNLGVYGQLEPSWNGMEYIISDSIAEIDVKSLSEHISCSQATRRFIPLQASTPNMVVVHCDVKYKDGSSERLRLGDGNFRVRLVFKKIG